MDMSRFTTIQLIGDTEANMPELNKTVLANLSTLKAYYRFESGALTTDSSGQGHTLTNNNTVAEATGVFGGGADFEAGSSQTLTVADHADFDFTDTFTIGVWFKPETLGIAQTIIHKGDGATAAGSSYAIYLNTSNEVKFDTYVGAGAVTATAGAAIVSTGVWYHIVATRTGGISRIYINGKNIAVTTSAGNANNTAEQVIIGNLKGAAWYLDGIIDDLFLLNGTALSADQIKELYEGRYLGELRPNQFGTTVGLWHLNGNSTDFSGNNNHGTDTAITYSQANGKFGQGAGFNGSTSKIILNNNNLGITTGAITFSAWFKIATQPITTNYYTLVFHDSTSNLDRSIYYASVSGVIQVGLDRTKQGIGNYFTLFNCGELIGWHHLVATDTGTAQALYLDGVLVASNTLSGTGSSGGVNASSIGCADYNGTTYNRLNGSIDEAFVCSTALTANQIRQIYALGKGMYY